MKTTSILRQLAFFTLSFVIFLSIDQSQAEPWLSNRFAQNCAGCHAPGRYNRVPSERRCTLSCQGCHVNPNGGGMRSEYGKWNQDTWLYSFTPSAWRLGHNRPLPLAEQDYTRDRLATYLQKISPNPDAPERKEATKRIIEKGLPMRDTPARVSENEFNKYNSAFEKITEPNPAKFIAGVPTGDPLRQRDDNIVTGGGGLRYFHIEATDLNGEKSKRDMVMTADVSLKVEPIRRFSMVTEAAFANGTGTEFFQGYTSGSFARSAYFMVDDLPYNTFVMSGLYRPLFGNYDVDHNSVLSQITNMRYNTVTRATTLGTAPNVPFLNVHTFAPIDGPATGLEAEAAKAKGYLVNLGGRFVTLGASITFSYWDTKSELSTTTIKRQMTSLAIGGMYGRWIPNIDVVKVKKETTTRVDEGIVYSAKNKFQLWREIYGLVNYQQANVALSMLPGKSSEYGFGIKSYLVSGLDLELLYYQRKSENDTMTELDSKYIQGQLHFFF